ncbi:thiamine pyrophosphate-binding protein [Oceanospirillaceae bacterium]|nr:thiamine pyrophosphate-binding protein [Oceanospirillaceae bacterium]|tara:strand:- start:439 stop:2106 length:1668 start_codon:yes stop_codon:yes gene_type:complete
MTQCIKSGGELVVDALEAFGVTQLFCVPGESYLEVLDALHDSPINATSARQEGGAAMMAEAWGKLHGTPGICFVTRGPGATNASAGIHVAQQDSTPMILFIGQINSKLRHREAFQEVDYGQYLGSMAKWVAEIDSPERITEMVSRAWSVATSGRPGPVVLVLPEDTLSGTAVSTKIKPFNVLETYPSQADLQQMATMIESAKKPILILGGSRWCKDSVSQIEAFAEGFNLPVACSFRRQMLFNHGHPHYAGDVGLGINPQLKSTIANADLVILMGGRFSEVPSQNYELLGVHDAKQKLIHIHASAEELGRVYRADLAIHASPKALAQGLSELTPTAKISHQRIEHIAQCHTHYQHWSRVSDKAHPGHVQMPVIITHLAATLPLDAIITNGAGNYATWIHRFWKFAEYGTQLAPTSGSMGYGLPAAVAAKIAFPQKTVVAFAGDGCFQMTMQEFGTAVQANAAVIVLVIDNGMYGTIRMHQERHFPSRVSTTDLVNPDFCALAKAYNAFATQVTHSDQFSEALADAIAAKKPALIHIKLDPQAMTPNQTLDQIRDQ